MNAFKLQLNGTIASNSEVVCIRRIKGIHGNQFEAEANIFRICICHSLTYLSPPCHSFPNGAPTRNRTSIYGLGNHCFIR
jgi:hypothetical protein